ncbi:sensor histidine kinase [Rhodococcus gannanensis]|uniref:histidine kinase n=1 Tax=Rhodococcus gannanensis TaxID=1960308 RepID=A0ABW4P3Y9_9NOCA
MSVQGWFTAILAVLLVLIAIGGVTAAILLVRTERITDELVEELLPARATAYRLQSSFLNQETGLRGYAATGDDAFLAPYNGGVELQRNSSDQLRALIGDRPALLADVDAIDEAAEEWRTVFGGPVLGTSGDATRPLDPAVYDLGRVAFDDLRSMFATQDRHLEEARAAAQQDLVQARQLRVLVLGAVFAVLLVACVGFAVLIRMAVINPVQRLARSSREVVEGNFDRTVDAGSGPADIQALASDIEAMRRRIVTELEVVRERQTQLEDQTRLLDAQTVELRRSNAELEQFAYVTSHDLQEPLRKVASFCQLLEKRYGDVLDDRGRQYIDFAVDGAKRMQVLINDLLAFSRVGRVNDGFQQLSLDQGLDRALTNLATAVEEAGARIVRPDALPEIVGDPTLIAMLWQNLIGNAIKFTRPGETPIVSITAHAEGEEWSICVQDNGIGISQEFAEKVFVIFQRLHARDEYSGTGIGLSLCKKIVEYHGGRIWLDTTYVDGARFCFTFPMTPRTDDVSANTTNQSEGIEV